MDSSTLRNKLVWVVKNQPRASSIFDPVTTLRPGLSSQSPGSLYLFKPKCNRKYFYWLRSIRSGLRNRKKSIVLILQKTVSLSRSRKTGFWLETEVGAVSPVHRKYWATIATKLAIHFFVELALPLVSTRCVSINVFKTLSTYLKPVLTINLSNIKITELEATGWEARMLPLCHAAPPPPPQGQTSGHAPRRT